jgi:hypothetical protein
MRSASSVLLLASVSTLAGCSSSPGKAVVDGSADAGGGFALPDAQGQCRAGTSPPTSTGSPDPLCTASLPSVSFAKDVVPVLGMCTGEICHAPWRYDTMVGRRSTACCDGRWLVAPGQPSASHIIQAVRSDGACVPQMPLDEGALADADIAKLVAWVCQGALDN